MVGGHALLMAVAAFLASHTGRDRCGWGCMPAERCDTVRGKTKEY